MEIEKGAGKLAKTLRVLILDKPGYLGKLTSAIGMAGSNIGDIRLVRMGLTHNTRELTIYVDSDEHLERILDNLSKVEGIIVEEVIDLVHQLHEGGKIAMKGKLPIKGIGDIRKIYTPGVAAICRDIQKKPELAWKYTAIPNLVAIVTNGTAILGLGDIGAVAGMPVMEGKAALFDHLVGISGIPILIQNKDPQVIIETVRHIAPTFGAIKLEDIAAPECFAIEDALDEMLDIPVMHDDQHGTAIIVGAALLNALDLVGKRLEDVRVVFSGAGAAGVATARYLVGLGVPPAHLLLTDIDGVVHAGRDDPPHLKELAAETGLRTLAEAITDADVFIGVSAGGVLTPGLLRSMARDPIVFALANPVPEIDPELARATRPDVVVATGRSDHVNQVNNVLAFPYVFRGALDTRATAISDGMKHAATQAIARLAREPITAAAGFDGGGAAFGRDYLIPKPFDRRLLPVVASAVAHAAMEGGVAGAVVEPEGHRARLETIARL